MDSPLSRGNCCPNRDRCQRQGAQNIPNVSDMENRGKPGTDGTFPDFRSKILGNVPSVPQFLSPNSPSPNSVSPNSAVPIPPVSGSHLINQPKGWTGVSPQGLKPAFLLVLAARLKPCPSRNRFCEHGGTQLHGRGRPRLHFENHSISTGVASLGILAAFPLLAQDARNGAPAEDTRSLHCATHPLWGQVASVGMTIRRRYSCDNPREIHF